MRTIVFLSSSACSGPDSPPTPAEVPVETRLPIVQGVLLGVEDDEIIENTLGVDYFASVQVLAFAGTTLDGGEIETSDHLSPCFGMPDVDTSCLLGALVAVDVGRYEVENDYTPDYVDLDTWLIGFPYRESLSGEPPTLYALFDLPAAPSVFLPANHSLGVPLDIDLSGQGYQGAAIVVFDGTRAVWTSLPQTYEGMEAENLGTDVGIVTIPGEVFAEKTTYLVGVAGTRTNRERDLVGMDPRSRVRAGKLRFGAVSTTNDW